VHEIKAISFERLPGTRIVAKPETLDGLDLPEETVVLRFAPDEAFIFPPLSANQSKAVRRLESDAIVVAEGSFSAAWIPEDHALPLLERLAEWKMPDQRPAFAQGAVAGVPAKLWFSNGKVLFLVLTPLAQELEDRLHE